jgi:aspartyl protease family protein
VNFIIRETTNTVVPGIYRRAIISTIDTMSSIMRYLTWVAALFLLTLFFNNWLKERENPNQYLMSTGLNDEPVTLKRNRQGHYVASGLINGEPVVFLLDTGATLMSVPENLAERIGLEKGRSHLVNTANGTISVYSTRLDEVQLGHISMRDVRADINPYMEGNTVLMGMSFLQHFELKQVGDTLSIAIPESSFSLQ